MKKRKTYTAFEKILGLLPKLSVAECLILRDAVENPLPGHLWYIKHSLKHGRYCSYKQTVDPDKTLELDEKSEECKCWVPMTISDKPL